MNDLTMMREVKRAGEGLLNVAKALSADNKALKEALNYIGAKTTLPAATLSRIARAAAKGEDWREEI